MVNSRGIIIFTGKEVINMKESVLNVKNTLYELDMDGIENAVQKCLDDGVQAWEIVNDGMSEGMKAVGKKFESGDYFLADLVLSGAIMKMGMELLGDRFNEDEKGMKGTVILATAKGDIHDIGKNIVATLVSAAGFQVKDLGVDVHEDRIVEAVRETGAKFIGFSVLLTTMVGGIKDLVNAFKEAGLRDKVKIVIGGACCSQGLADEMGVDAFGEDAVQAVRIFEEFSSKAGTE